MQVMKAAEHFAHPKAAMGHPPDAWPPRLDLCQLMRTLTLTTHGDTGAYLHLDNDNLDLNPTRCVLLSNFPGWKSSPGCWIRPTTGNPAFSNLPKLLKSYPQLSSAFRWYPLLFQFGTLEGEEQFSGRTLWKSYWFFPYNPTGSTRWLWASTPTAWEVWTKRHPLPEKLRWRKGDFLRGTVHAFPLLEISTCPFLRYFLVLQKKVLRHHPPLRAPAISFSKACVEILGKPVLPRRTAQIHLLSLRVPGTEMRGSRYIITHLWGTLVRVTRDAQCKLRSFFLSSARKSRLILTWIMACNCDGQISDKRCVHTVRFSSLSLEVRN